MRSLFLSSIAVGVLAFATTDIIAADPGSATLTDRERAMQQQILALQAQLKVANETIASLQGQSGTSADSTAAASTAATTTSGRPPATPAVAPAVAQAATPATTPESAGPALQAYNATQTRDAEQARFHTPTSVSVVGPKELQLGGVEDVTRLQYLVPSLRFGQVGHEAQQAMRGARTNSTGAESSPVVAVYEDGINIATTTEQMNSWLDVQRVDVLRGPQITEFGQQAYAGAVSVVSNKPTFDGFSGYAELENGLPDKTRWRMAMNIPASDTLSFRLAGLSDSKHGLIDNSYISGDADDLNDRAVQIVRASVLWQPSDIFSVLFWSRYLDENGNGSAPWGYQQVGAYVDGELQPGNQFAGAGYHPDAGPWTVDRNMIGTAEFENWLNTVDLNWDMGFASLQWLFNYTAFHGKQTYDNDYTNLEQVNTTAFAGWNTSQTGWSNEMRLTSNQDSDLTWLAAVYQSSRDADWGYLQDDNGDTSRPSWDAQGAYKTKTSAIYGQLSYAITDRFRTTGGLRWNDEKKTTRTGVKGSWDDVLWKAALEYDVAGDIMSYLSISTGYRAGGNNTASGVNPTWAPERLTAYELGMKSLWADDTVSLNASLWWNEFKDVQSQSFLVLPYPGSPEATEYTGNGGPLSANGVDAEVQWNPTENWDISTNIAYTHARFGNYIAASYAGLGDIPGHSEGDDLNFDGWSPALSPDWVVGLRAAYTFHFRHWGRLTPYVQTTYASAYYINDINLPGLEQGSNYQTDLRIMWQSPNESFNLQFYYLNFSDEAVMNGSRVYNPAARPDITTLQANWDIPNTYGVIFNYTF
jgi:outer membrane receptor protein involved in Fe transport